MKFPINPLLYLGIVGLAGGGAMQFLETYKVIKSPQQPRIEAANAKLTELVDAGMAKKVVAKGPDYSDKRQWEHFKTANLIGKEPPPPPEVTKVEDKEPEVVEKPLTPLEEICSIAGLLYRGGNSRVVVRYLPDSGVQPPAEIVEAQRNASAAAAAPRSNLPQRGSADRIVRNSNRGSNRKSNRNPPPAARGMPTGAGSAIEGWVHIIKLEDTLWPPFENIRLARVDESGDYAEFVRKDKDGVEGDPEKFFPDTLGISQELLRQLAELEDAAGVAGGGDAKLRTAQRGDGSGRSEASRSGQNNRQRVWQAGKETRRVGNDYHIGTVDWNSWGKDPGAILNHEIGTRSYSKGGVTGVQVTKVSSRMANYGVNGGDVIVAVNGQSVGSKAEAIRVGKQLHKRGVRNLEVTMLSRGRRVNRNYVLPEN